MTDTNPERAARGEARGLANRIREAREDIQHGIPPATALDNMTLRIAADAMDRAYWMDPANVGAFLDRAGVGTGGNPPSIMDGLHSVRPA